MYIIRNGCKNYFSVSLFVSASLISGANTDDLLVIHCIYKKKKSGTDIHSVCYNTPTAIVIKATLLHVSNMVQENWWV